MSPTGHHSPAAPVHPLEGRSVTQAVQAGTPYVLAFAGQGTPWRQTLEELASSDTALAQRLVAIDRRVAERLAPVATELLTVSPRGLRVLDDSARPTSPAPLADAQGIAPELAADSVPGILFAQTALLEAAAPVTLAVQRPAAVCGHSQGVLGVALTELLSRGEGLTSEAAVEVHAIAHLIGAAAQRCTQRAGLGPVGSATPMLSVRRVPLETLREVLRQGGCDERVSVGVRNGVDASIVVGHPQDLLRVVELLERAAARSAEERRLRQRGGSILSPVLEFLPTSVPFHTQALAPAVNDTVAWAAQCGLPTDLARDLAAAVLTDTVDWPAQLRGALDSSGAQLVLDMGPGTVLARMSEAIVAGRGVHLVAAGSLADCDRLDDPSVRYPQPVRRSQWVPQVVQLPDGSRRLSTAFTRLTGRSAVLLAGMTPTTVDPRIVAAAANAGFWAELAGGGQTTAAQLTRNLEGLADQLQPGRTAAFNAMFMDRYLWNLHLGSQRLLSKARAGGAPIDGIVISAGIPDVEEATALLSRLRAEGFPYVAFKPGTIEQIRQVITIATASPQIPVIMQVEDGHAGGHHSWEDLDTMLLATYDAIRAVENLVLVVGGGIGTPQKAADYLTGRWARQYDTVDAPVDGVMVGTAAMTCLEAATNDDVKRLLVDTPGIDPQATGPDSWVASGASRGGMTSGLSHLRADLYEIDNASARASRLIQELAGDEQAMQERREEMIAALNQTAKPYFGDVDSMTYLQWATRYAQLCVAPHEGRAAEAGDWVDDSWYDRFYDLLQRIEARLHSADHGQIPTLFASREQVIDADRALATLSEAYPQAAETQVEPTDAAWFVDLCRKHPKPVPFVPVVDADILRWWGTDSLWQSHDPRYTADQVRIIPGPISVAGITTMNEPVGELLSRFEADAVDSLLAAGPATPVASRLGQASSVEEAVAQSPHVLWNGHLSINPATVLSPEDYELVARPDRGADAYDLCITLDTHWDGVEAASSIHAVRQLDIPLRVAGCADGGVPVVDADHIGDTMTALLHATAGVGSVSTSGDEIASLPPVRPSVPGATNAAGQPVTQPCGTVHDEVTLGEFLGRDHAAVTGNALPTALRRAAFVPDALVGPCWPTIYAALGSVVEDGMPLIEGLLGAVHLDHTVDLRLSPEELNEWATQEAHAGGAARVDVDGWVEALEDSSAGRIVDVRLELRDHAEGTLLALLRERFAIRGRAHGQALPSAAALYGALAGDTPESLPATRRQLRHVRVQAPTDMTAFARISGDFNPIHTSTNAARVAGMEAPLVHGMWLSATAQQAVMSALTGDVPLSLRGWTYQMSGPVQLNDVIDITVERTGLLPGGEQLLDVTCRIDDEVVSRGTARVAAERTAYLFPGQGIQAQGMGLDEMTSSPAARQVWDRADAFTREALGFSVISLVRHNPTELTARGVMYRHPEGLLNLTQFTQVALATVAMATTAHLREAGALVDGAAFAGHSLGEYTALSAYGEIMDIETTLDIVFQRGSTMHSLVPRAADGSSDYKMAALRPNQCGMSAAEVEEYISSIAQRSGEFLQIVNYNLAGMQYAVAGTVTALACLEEDSRRRAQEHGGKNPFMYVPGIDVPFHSSVLRPGVDDFRARLEQRIPAEISVERLEGRYVPNLVARPFALTREFAQAICEVVPSQQVSALLEHWDEASADRNALARTLLIELLAWQFASPVRWIDTQNVLMRSVDEGGMGVTHLVEVGLATAPTLANLAARTLSLPEHEGRTVTIHNTGRDAARVWAQDSDPLHEEVLSAVSAAASQSQSAAPASGALASSTPSSSPAVSSSVTPEPPAAAVADSPGAGEQAVPCAGNDAAPVGSALAAHASANVPATSAAPAAPATPAAPAAEPTGEVNREDLPFGATDALTMLMAHSARLLPEQIAATDTTDSLTNGVSSRRNQLLMDMGAELELASIDGAADADMPTLAATVAKGAPGYKPFGPVLTDVVRSALGRVFGPSGVRPARIAERLSSHWGLGEGWTAHVTAALVLGTREGASLRGGELASLGSSAAVSTAAAVDALIDSAVAQVAQNQGRAVSPLGSGSAAGGATVDSAALDALSEQVLGAQGVLASTASAMLEALGLADTSGADIMDPQAAASAEALAAISAELGSDWVSAVQPAFDPRRAVLIDDRWATAREDLARLGYGDTPLTDELSAPGGALAPARFTGMGQTIAEHAQWWESRLREDSRLHDAPQRATLMHEIAQAALRTDAPGEGSQRFAGEVAVVTGVAPGSIAAAVVAGLLAGGATVVATSSRLSHDRLAFATELYARHATAGAALWMVPANLNSFRDVDTLVEWIGTEQSVTVGGTTTRVKPALVPTLLVPFAAPRVSGTLADAGAQTERQARLLLWSLERTIAGLAAVGTDTHVDHRLHVLLPGSPNRGTFGGDGAYGEVKAAFDAIVNRWSVEKVWGRRTSLVRPAIGWVRGTGLMGGNDPLVDAVEAAGVRTWSTSEIASELLQLCTPEYRAAASQAPVEVDLTGGLSRGIDLAALKAQAMAEMAAQASAAEPVQSSAAESARAAGSSEQNESAAPCPCSQATIAALPSPATPVQAIDVDWPEVSTDLHDMVVIVSTGEVSTWGTARTRRQAELGVTGGEDVELTAAGVLELAWGMGLLTWQDTPKAGWYDTEGEFVPESEIWERYRDEVVARCGIREFSDDGLIATVADEEVGLYLDRNVTLTVADEASARDIAQSDPEHTVLRQDPETGEWSVTRLAGSYARVPKRAALSRTVGGQFPTGFDPERWGIPASMTGAMDKIAAWNLVTAVEAFLSAGFSPAELLQAVHPADVASTQGTGFGGMESMRKMFVGRFLGEERSSDILQEALPNVVAAHVMQSFIGGYGSMVQPVSACATAAVSIEEGWDKIALGKADVVIAGAIDDISIESVVGFGNMNATAETAAMRAKGISDRHFSRANDRRRGGFVEAQGGGTVILARGDVAARLGLPVAGVLGFVSSYADGAHTSIPAPGLGALAAGRGGADSRLARALRALGVGADDVAVVSKHDTSTNANDPNESELHTRLAQAVGRSAGNPLIAVSQKSLTGHAKGGAAVFQVSGLTEILASGVIPGNASLDVVDAPLQADPFWVWPRTPLRVDRTLRCGLLTSLGFGHVSGLIAVVHPGAFAAALRQREGQQAVDRWLEQANARLRAGERRRRAGMMGHVSLFEQIDARRFGEDAHECEARMLLDPQARLGADGYYR